MNWLQIKISCKHEDLKKVSAIASMLDSRIQVEDYSDIRSSANAYYGELIDESLLRADNTRSKVMIYIDENNDYREYLSFLKERFTALGIDAEIDIESLVDEDWQNSWKQYFKPIKISKRLVVVPAWETYEPGPDDVIITMDPGMAFGAGTHETTQLCLRMIDEHMPEGSRAIDVGTGSGILAIAEAKLGASEVYACDLDPDAVRVAKDNIGANGVEVNCFESNLLDKLPEGCERFDFMSANIVADIILKMIPSLSEVMKTGALVALSGIIDDQANRVTMAMERAGFGLSDVLSDNGWKALLFTKLSDGIRDIKIK
ncbi:MAG: 50S ribosomal protein L11 methyltransferase [Clostridia bacterium]|nr:50S ribosomal protein L11 methyltransferase [Clostridia bacterium]